MTVIPTLTTARLILRPFKEADVTPLHHIMRQTGVLQYFPNPNPPSKERVEKFIANQLKQWNDYGFAWWAVEHAATQTFMGWNGLQYLPDTDEIEIGYLLGKDFWGQGFATEGAKLGLEFGFKTLKLKTIIALVHPQNTASQNVIKKLGLTFTHQAEYFGIELYRYEIHGT